MSVGQILLLPPLRPPLLLLSLLFSLSLLLSLPSAACFPKFMQDSDPIPVPLSPYSNQSFPYTISVNPLSPTPPFLVLSLQSDPSFNFTAGQYDSFLLTVYNADLPSRVYSSYGANGRHVLLIGHGVHFPIEIFDLCFPSHPPSLCNIVVTVVNRTPFSTSLLFNNHNINMPTATTLPFNQVHTVGLRAGEWRYFSFDASMSNFNLLITLSPAAGTASAFRVAIANQSDPLDPMFTTATTTGEALQISIVYEPNVSEGVYVLGLKGIAPDADENDGSIVIWSNYEEQHHSLKLSIFALIAALVIALIAFFMICTCLAKRRRLAQQHALIAAIQSSQQLQLQLLAQQLQRGAGGGGARASGEEALTAARLRQQIELFRSHAPLASSSAVPGATEQEIAAIPSFLFSKALCPAESSCTICLAEWERGDRVKRLNCGHLFCDKCATQWLRVKRQCALCRRDIACAPVVLSPQQKKRDISSPSTVVPIDNLTAPKPSFSAASSPTADATAAAATGLSLASIVPSSALTAPVPPSSPEPAPLSPSSAVHISINADAPLPPASSQPRASRLLDHLHRLHNSLSAQEMNSVVSGDPSPSRPATGTKEKEVSQASLSISVPNTLDSGEEEGKSAEKN